MRIRTAWRLVRFLSIGWLVALPVAGTADEPTRITIHAEDQGYLFREGETKVLFYQRRSNSLDGEFERANYVHPLYGLHGEELTEDFPWDHRHHRGIFWAWHQVSVGNQRLGDPWLAKDFVWDVTEAEPVLSQDASPALRVRVLWKSPRWTDPQGNLKPIVDEQTAVRAHPRSRNTRAIDFEIRLLALEDNVRIGGSEDRKGYGGFSVRVRLPDDVEFSGRDGVLAPQIGQVNAGPWVNLTGTFDAPSRRGGVAMLSHPSLPAFPPKWILRAKGSMQNPVYPGRHAIALSRTDPLVLRHRLVIHDGNVGLDELDALQQQYAQSDGVIVPAPATRR